MQNASMHVFVICIPCCCVLSINSMLRQLVAYRHNNNNNCEHKKSMKHQMFVSFFSSLEYSMHNNKYKTQSNLIKTSRYFTFAFIWIFVYSICLTVRFIQHIKKVYVRSDVVFLCSIWKMQLISKLVQYKFTLVVGSPFN